MGDYADCITHEDKRFDIVGYASWVEKGNIVSSQRKWLKELLAPIKDKCICLLTGNHEETIHQRHETDFTRDLCDDLGVQYAGYHCFLVLQFYRGKGVGEGSANWSSVWHLWHGSGSAQKEGARVSRLMQLVNEIVADGYMMGHLHTKTLYEVDRLSIKQGRIKSQSVKAFITGSWLKTYNQPDAGQKLSPSYGERGGYKPSCIGCPTVKFRPEHQEYKVEF